MEQAKLSTGRAELWQGDKPLVTVMVLDGKKKQLHTINWFYAYQGVETGVTFVEQAKLDKPLTQTEYRVRDMLLGSMGLGNWGIVNQAELARQIRVHRPDVSKAIKRLIELGIVERGEKLGKSCQYRISPGFSFKGTIAEGQAKAREAASYYKTHGKVIPFSQGSLLEPA